MTLEQYLEQKTNEARKKVNGSNNNSDFSRGYLMGQYNLLLDLQREIRTLSTTPQLTLK